MNAAHFDVTPELLREMLRLPAGTVIRDVAMNPDGFVRMTVEHETLPVQSSGELPLVRPRYNDYHGHPIFLGWQ